MRTSLESNRFLPYKTYLIDKWCNQQIFSLWGRLSDSGVPFAQTTMHIEGQWSTIKRHYMLMRNRSRVDFLVFVLAKKLMPALEDDFRQFSEGRNVSGW